MQLEESVQGGAEMLFSRIVAALLRTMAPLRASRQSLLERSDLFEKSVHGKLLETHERIQVARGSRLELRRRLVAQKSRV
jgi:hypothetical protein